MKNKLIPFVIIAVVLICVMAAWIVFTHDTANNDASVVEEDPMALVESDDDDLIDHGGNDIYFEEEDDEAVIEKVTADASDYYGSWEATSDMAHYLYGSIELTVKDDGTWKGEVTDLPLGGTWEYLGDHMHMTDTVEGIFDFDLAFDKGGHLILTDSSNGDEVNTVLTKKQ